MIRFIRTALTALTISALALPPFVAPAFAEEQKAVHGKAKMGGGGLHAGGGGKHGGIGDLGGLGGKGAAGVAAGIIGLAIGAAAIDAIAKSNAPAAPAPVAQGCHMENQPLFDANGNQVAAHRVRVCD